MSRNKDPKPVTWPWIITACLMPLLIAACIVVFSYSAKRDTHEARIAAARNKMAAYSAPLKALSDRMSGLIDKSGVAAPVVPATLHSSQDLEAIPVRKEEPTPIHAKWNQFQQDYRNSGEYGIAAMRAQKARYSAWSSNLAKTVAYLVYTDRYGTGATDQVAVGEAVTVDRLVSETAQLRRLTTIGDVKPEDPRMAEAFKKLLDRQPSLDPRAPASGSTLNSIAALQRDLIRVLSSVTVQQYAIAYQNAASWTKLDDRTKALTATFERIKNDFQGKEGSDGMIEAMAKAFEEIAVKDKAAKSGLWAEQVYAINTSNQSLLADIARRNNDYDQMVRNHETDAFEFRRLLQENKLVGTESVLTTAFKRDATVKWVNRDTKECHIDLGSGDNVHPGMRFEVWQMGGTGKEYQKAMVEVIRVLSSTYSLCTILDLVESDDPIREGDAAINVLWENGKYLSVALHGKGWDPASTKYGKFRLKAILEDIGVTVHDQLNPNTDAVILGMQWSLDPIYNEAKKHIVRDTYSEKRIRMYVDRR